MEKGSIVNNVTYTMKPGKRADFLREMRESGLLEAVRSEDLGKNGCRTSTEKICNRWY